MVTWCEQLDSLLQERRETLCSLEADRDQVGSVVSSEFEGATAANGCTRSLGGMEAPEPIVVSRIPSVIVPVCVVKGVSAPPCVSGVVTSVPGCVLPSTPCASEAGCVSGTACVRSLYEREMTVGMSEHAAASPGVSVMEWCVSVVTRRCAWVEWRRRRRRRNEGRVAAVAAMGTAPGLQGDEREVRTVPGTRPPLARLRE